MRGITGAAFAALLCVFLGGCSSFANGNAPQISRTVFVMDTAASVKGAESDVEAAVDTLTSLDRLFDRYNPQSDVYAINARDNSGISQISQISNNTAELIRQSVELSETYGGAVSIFAGDITDAWGITSGSAKIPTEREISDALASFNNASFSLDTMSFADENGSLDLGSVAKGFALDKVKEKLEKRLGNEPCVVSMSSSILLHGSKPNGEKFSVAIRDPEDGSRTLGTLYTDECFLSTSGGYERFFEVDGRRYIHIFDLSTGAPCESDLTSVTVICNSGIKSDFLSTLIFIGGTERLGEFMSDKTLKIIAVTDDKTVIISEGVELKLDESSGCTLKVWEDFNNKNEKASLDKAPRGGLDRAGACWVYYSYIYNV